MPFITEQNSSFLLYYSSFLQLSLKREGVERNFWKSNTRKGWWKKWWMSGKRSEERTGRREGPRETENPVLQHCSFLMFHHHRMLSILLVRQMFQKHSETEIYPLHLCGGGIEEDWQENGYCRSKLETSFFQGVWRFLYHISFWILNNSGNKLHWMQQWTTRFHATFPKFKYFEKWKEFSLSSSCSYFWLWITAYTENPKRHRCIQFSFS